MIRVVLDTNVLVSALWSAEGNCAKIISMVFENLLIPCYDYKILLEYRLVLNRPKLNFSNNKTKKLLSEIENRGISVFVKPSSFEMIDESDRKFYDVYTFCEAFLITGNKKHYPQEPNILDPSDFLYLYP